MSPGAEADRRIVATLHRLLVEELRRREHPPERPVKVSDLYKDLVPYRRVRSRLGVDLNADYEHALLRLLAGEDGRVRLEPEEARQELEREASTAYPFVGLFRKFAGSDAWVRFDTEKPAEVDVAAATSPAEKPEATGGSGTSTAPPAPAAPSGTEAPEAPTPARSPAPARPAARETPASAAPAARPSSPAPPSGSGEAAEPAPPPPAAKPRGPEPPYDFEDEGRHVPRPEPPTRRSAGSGPVPLRPRHPAPARTTSPVRLHQDPPAEAAAELGPSAECRFCHEALPRERPARYCPFCGADQRLLPCPRCDAALEPGWRYCIRCGHEVVPG